MKIRSPLPERKARIEIIPLIDIMFFLLAAFMLASLALIHLNSIKVKLPIATPSERQLEPAIVNIAVDRRGEIYVDQQRLNVVELSAYLAKQIQQGTNVPVYISGDRDARHGDVIRVLDLVRRQGIRNVAFAISTESAP